MFGQTIRCICRSPCLLKNNILHYDIIRTIEGPRGFFLLFRRRSNQRPREIGLPDLHGRQMKISIFVTMCALSVQHEIDDRSMLQNMLM